jgi:hypothetical protein
MRIDEVYKKFNIPLNLQEHMLRVTAVGQIIIDNLSIKIDKKAVIDTLLVHDLGNIVKFKLDNEKDILFPKEQLEYWRRVKDEVIKKYGIDDHGATTAMLRELGVSQHICELTDKMAASKIDTVLKNDDWECKVCLYADLRVGPHGVITLQERIDDLTKRYQGRADTGWFVERITLFFEVEKQIQEKCTISLVTISDNKVKPLIENLKELELFL